MRPKDGSVCVCLSKLVLRENLKDFRETVETGWMGMGPQRGGWSSRITYLPSSILYFVHYREQ